MKTINKQRKKRIKRSDTFSLTISLGGMIRSMWCFVDTIMLSPNSPQKLIANYSRETIISPFKAIKFVGT